MAGQRLPLGTRADGCVDKLQSLNLESLQAWITELKTEHATRRDEVVADVARLFDTLDRSIGFARRDLRSRLRYRRRYLIAYDFSASGNSKTRSPNVYSQRYAAPEIVDSVTKSVSADRRTIVLSDLDRIVQDGADIFDEQIESDFKETEENGHGRMTDIFSLGCVFLEVLACIFNEKLPMDRVACLPRKTFSKHVPELTMWARERMESSSMENKFLSPLLNLSINMICRNPQDRPTVAEVVQKVASVCRQHFCDGCWEEHRKDQKTNRASPQSPAETPPRKVSSKSQKGSVARIFTRVNSGGRPQTTRLSSTLSMREAG